MSSLEDDIHRDLRTIEAYVTERTGGDPPSRSASTHYFTADGQPMGTGTSAPRVVAGGGGGPSSMGSTAAVTDHTVELVHLIDTRLTRPQRAALLQALRRGATVHPLPETLRRTVFSAHDDVIVLAVAKTAGGAGTGRAAERRGATPVRTAAGGVDGGAAPATPPPPTAAAVAVVARGPPLAPRPRQATPSRTSALRGTTAATGGSAAVRTESPAAKGNGFLRIVRSTPAGGPPVQTASKAARSPARAELTIATSASRRQGSTSPPRHAASPTPKTSTKVGKETAVVRSRGAVTMGAPPKSAGTVRSRTPAGATPLPIVIKKNPLPIKWATAAAPQTIDV